MRLPRASGILLHLTSLPNRFGIGDLGPSSDAFLDFLVETGQRWWQFLPLGPTGYGNSPYQSLSSHAGNPLLISPDRLVADGLLTAEDLKHYPELPDEYVDYDQVIAAKHVLLRAAFNRFDSTAAVFRTFCRREAGWLDDFALFLALKNVHGGRTWTSWEPKLASREPKALERAREALADEIRLHQFAQYVFDAQFNRLRERAKERSLGLIGDVPIFVAHDSADVWTHPELFELDGRGRPTVVAGVPPDYFSATGQLWGNPLYRWSVHAETGFAWWAERLRASLRRCDLVRLDHFRGFQAYWEVPADAMTAEHGRWVFAPGLVFLEAMRAELGGLPLVAEDLGFITLDVHALRDQFDLPGMRILQFAFAATFGQERPYNYPRHCLVYTGTHDNDTTVGWFSAHGAGTQSIAEVEAERWFIRQYLGTEGNEIHWDLIRLAFSCTADTAIIPLQDVLGLGSEARMNTPGKAVGNWRWRYSAEQLSRGPRERLAELTTVYGRSCRHAPTPLPEPMVYTRKLSHTL